MADQNPANIITDLFDNVAVKAVAALTGILPDKPLADSIVVLFEYTAVDTVAGRPDSSGYDMAPNPANNIADLFEYATINAASALPVLIMDM